MRLVCMLRIADHTRLAALQRSWEALTPTVRDVLKVELGKSGMRVGDEAIVLYYSPQLLINAGMVRLRLVCH